MSRLFKEGFNKLKIQKKLNTNENKSLIISSVLFPKITEL